MAREEGVDFNLRMMTLSSELAMYGVIAKEPADGMCEIVNPIYLYCIITSIQAGCERVGG